MNRFKPIKFWLLALTAAALGVAGCAPLNVNPPAARANTGYVDFHAESSTELNWEVVRFDERTQSFHNLYWELKPPPAEVLRLAFAPGRYRLRVTFLNRVVTNPVVVEVEVADGKITPVRITLTAAGTGLVETRERNFGGTAKGRYARRTKIGSDETVMYSLTAEVGPAVAYQPRERMPYAH